MYHVSAQGVDERMINVRYYYYYVCGFHSILSAASGPCLLMPSEAVSIAGYLLSLTPQKRSGHHSVSDHIESHFKVLITVCFKCRILEKE